VGLIVLAYGLSSRCLPRYRLSGGCWAEIEDHLRSDFTRIAAGSAACGDLVVERLPRCFHFAVRGAASIIHADLRIRRVVETPVLSLGGEQRTYRKI
jgi:hypothetical protein